MAVDRTIFDEPHYESLELLAALALADGNIAPAFELADRRCRILPTPEAHCYVLRGEASYQMGRKADALADIAEALEIAPDDIAANRRMLTWAEGRQQMKAALTLIRFENDFVFLSRAMSILQKRGQRKFGRVEINEDTIEGWAAWDGKAELEVSITDDTQNVHVALEPDAFHPLAEYGHAVSFRVPRPKSSRIQTISLSAAENVFHSARAAGNTVKSSNNKRQETTVSRRQTTVIVPVYSDYKTTTLCLEALRDGLRPSDHRAIIVNDASPDPRIADYVAKFAAGDNIKILINADNLGFAGSVNRALEQIKEGDVIILNSDTIVPPNFIDRLAAAARSSPDIGTVTPLSNNGEFASFPIPNAPNPLLQRNDVNRLDYLAGQVNTGKVVDIPSGIGFCLYVTRTCLDAVGLLSDDFGRGYFEDVDFCLRARERGFRNVCAPSVYVGHAGSKSFGAERRSLVVRNLGVLEQRFPAHRSECAAFMAADPLWAARETIELEATDHASHPRILVTGLGAVGAVADERARQLVSAGQRVLVLKVRCGAQGLLAEITDPAGGIPQSLRFEAAPSGDCRILFNFLHSVEPERIEIVDPGHAPFGMIDMLLKLKIPCDIFIADAGLVGPEDAQPCAEAVRPSFVAQPNRRRGDADKVNTAPEFREWKEFWGEIAANAEEILVPCPHAQAFATTALPHRAIRKITLSAENCRKSKGENKTTGDRLGFVPVRSCAHEQWLMGKVAEAFSRIRPDLSISIVGTTLDDIGLMRNPNTFVTGAVGAKEVERLAASLSLDRIFVSTTRPLFGHPIISAVQSCRLPIAYFDWSRGSLKPDQGDLPIDPNAPLDRLVDELSEWMPRP